MPTPELTEPVTFNPLADGFVEWPYHQYARLRAEDPVHRSELLHGWCVTRHADVNAILRDPTVSSEIDNAEPTPLTIDEIARRDQLSQGGRTVVLLDDPDHAQLRRLISKPFRPREVDGLQALVEDRVRTKVDQLVSDKGTGPVELDLIADFAYPLPVEIFCEMLGIPEEDHPGFRFWVNCIARSLDPVIDPVERQELVDHIADMQAFLEELIAEKRSRDDDDILSGLIHAEEDGERLTPEDLLAQIVTLYVAGHEPTAGLVGNGMLALLRQPDQWALLQSDRSLLRNAVSELLRYDGPNQFVRRVAMRDMDFDTPAGRVTIPARSVVYASPGSANRDEARWGATVDQVDITREDAGQHLQFGAGIHACLGSHLARLQAETMFTALLDRFDGIELAGDPTWSTRMVIRGLNQLPVRATLR
ncbi:cytochrome P450 [Aquihabitans sp. McL0605]|uniref:cytochrome P450 n=1 Tax=Aquihabitans sp. McL0605 TaxID=3415671 RepID=UPI003CF428F5